MNKKTITILLSTALLLAACSTKQASTNNTSTNPPASATTESSGTATQGATKEVMVTGSSFKFDPAEIKVKKGDTVKITFKNIGGRHDFTLPDFNVKTNTLQSGQEETVQFVADKTGTFEYFCSVGNHREMGMKGNLIVE